MDRKILNKNCPSPGFIFRRVFRLWTSFPSQTVYFFIYVKYCSEMETLMNCFNLKF